MKSLSICKTLCRIHPRTVRNGPKYVDNEEKTDKQTDRQEKYAKITPLLQDPKQQELKTILRPRLIKDSKNAKRIGFTASVSQKNV